MAYVHYNPNPSNKDTGDCVVRAIAIAEGITWDEAYQELTKKAFEEKDMPSVNPIWANYLESLGYTVYGIPNTCPRCYTVRDFAKDHPYGTYVLGTGSHAIAVIDGNYIDTWDSGNEVPMYFFKKGVIKNGITDDEYVQRSEQSAVQPASNPANPTNTVQQPVPNIHPSPVSGSVLGAGS